MVYLYWTGALIVLSVLLVLPVLGRNRVYRTATLFAGMTAGIITLSYFINILRFGASSSGEEQFIEYFTISLPNLYIASLVVGSTIVPRFYLNASTRLGTAAATLGSTFSVYFFTIVVSNTRLLMSKSVAERTFSLDDLSRTVDHILYVLIDPGLSTLTIFFVSAFIALNGTATVMRMSDESKPSKSEETEQREA